MKLVVGFLVSILIGCGASAAIFGEVQNQCSMASIKGGDSVPWPWGNEIEIPWDHLEGTWKVVNSECEAYFDFIPTDKTGSSGPHLTKVVQYNPNSCDRISWGYGTETDRVIRASMTNGRLAFNLTVRAFPKEKVVPKNATPNLGESVIVLSMYPKNGWSYRVNYEIQKLPARACSGR